MLDSEAKPVPAVGVYRIDTTDRPAALKILNDGNTMLHTWKEWLKMAEEIGKILKAYGAR